MMRDPTPKSYKRAYAIILAIFIIVLLILARTKVLKTGGSVTYVEGPWNNISEAPEYEPPDPEPPDPY